MTSLSTLAKTPLTSWHEGHGARMVDFAGWSMPVQYGSIVEEHHATRKQAGLFDVSHMGRFRIEGPAAEAWLDGLLTRRVEGTPVGRVRYSLVCKEDGGTLDDILFTHAGDNQYDLVVNASNRAKLLDWFAAHSMADATLTDRTEETAMIAVQGPEAVELVNRLADRDLSGMKYYTSVPEATVANTSCAVSRTGYTGEDGYELICDAERAEPLWQALIDGGAQPCGLAARDTLRLEAGMPLYGHELDEETTPIQAGLGFAINLKNADDAPRDFVGAAALKDASNDPTLPIRVGLQVESKRPPREGYSVLLDGKPCGEVTSGTQSPTLGRPIAMAYVSPPAARGEGAIAIDIRGTETAAELAPLPFYKRN